MRPSRWAMALVVAVVVLTAGAFTAFAAPGLYRATTPAKSAAPPVPGAKAQQYCDSFLQAFASHLGHGVQKNDVVPALKAAAKDSVAQAVRNGDMTADQAAKANARIDAVTGCADLGKLGSMAGLHGGKHGRARGGPFAMGPQRMQDVMAAAATALKTTPADLQQAVMAGDSLKTVGSKHGVTDKGAFDLAFRQALTAQLDAQVTAGKLTRDQETRLIDKAVKIADKLWDKPLAGPGEDR
ncbi:MAG: hypothetical protein ABR598_08665 [Candidatus Dormibacteria bacterium]